jgi:Calx-beta domain
MLVPIIPLAALALSGAPAVSAGDASTYETNFDTDALVEVALSSPSDETVTVHWATADGTATSEDYLPDSGTLTFAPGETAKRIAVLIKGDALDEPDETFFVDLSGAEHATIERGRATVTIVDSDPAPYRLLDAWVDVRWSVHRNYTRVLKLAIHKPARTVVHVRCRGAGCPARVGRKLRPGALVDVRIEALYQPLIGRVYQYRIRSGKAPLFTARCLLPGSSTPSSC